MGHNESEEVDKSLSMLAKASILVFIGLVVSKVMGYAYRIIAARYFGPETYGLLSIAVIIMGWFIALFSFGLSEGLIRYIAVYNSEKKYDKTRRIFKSSLKLLIICGLVAGAIMFAASGLIAEKIFHNESLKLFIQVFSIGVPLVTVSIPFLSGMRALEKISQYSMLYNIIQNVAKVGILTVLIFLGVGAQSTSISYIFGLAVVLLGSYFYSRRHLKQLFVGKKDRNPDAWREVLSYSWPLMLYGIVSTVMYWIDSFSIGYFKDATAVGWYNAAVPIAMLVGIAPEIFLGLFFPMINRFYAQRRAAMVNQLGKQVAKWTLMATVPIFAACLIFPEVVINILFGAEYLAASTALRILSIGTIISAISTVPMQLVSMAGKSKALMINIALAATLNFVLNFILVPMPRILFIDNSTGINGAAIATTISLAFFGALYFVQAYRYTGIVPLRRKMLNVIISAALPLICLIWIKENADLSIIQTLIAIVAFAVAYIALLFATSSIDKHDKEMMRKAGKSAMRRLGMGSAEYASGM